MYHSITIGSMNTYDNWHLVSDGRPVIATPQQKMVTVDIPGRDGVLDLSEAVRHYPVFQNRSGTWTFHVLNDIENWAIIYEKIINYVQGRTMRITLEDDPGWYYIGKVALNSWTSNNDGTWSDVEIGYELQPYKISVSTSTDESWRWDDFSFVNGRIFGTGMKNISVESTSYETKSLSSFVGYMPVSPKFIINSAQGIDLNFVNTELGLNITKTGIKSGTYEWPEVVFTEFNKPNNIYIRYKKTYSNNYDDTFSIEYRIGSL